MRRPIALVSVAVLFAVGVLVGILGTHLYYAKLMREPRGPGRAHARFFLNRLEGELGLTPAQKERIDEILRESHAEGEAIHNELIPRVQEHLRSTRLQIEEVLTAEQREKFEQLNRRHRRSSEEWFLGRGLGPPLHGRGHRRFKGRQAPPGDEPPPGEPPPSPSD